MSGFTVNYDLEEIPTYESIVSFLREQGKEDMVKFLLDEIGGQAVLNKQLSKQNLSLAKMGKALMVEKKKLMEELLSSKNRNYFLTRRAMRMQREVRRASENPPEPPNQLLIEKIIELEEFRNCDDI